jgi:adenylate cyclase
VALTPPTFALLAAAGFGAAHVGRRQRFIRRAFERYVAPAVVARLAAAPESLKLGGERREITCLFTDLAGFTSLSEELPPEELVRLLNGYLDGLIRIALAHEGTVDKVIGDSVHVLFGAPDDQPDHPRWVVACALELDRFAEAFAVEQRARGVPFGPTRIGVHTGWATVGNFGGAERFDYTAHGDTVNTASRLEGANKHLGTRVCVSGATAGRCPDVAWRPVGDLVLAGKSAAVPAFEPAAAATAAGSDPDDLVAAYERAFARLRAGEPCARGAFEALLARRPDDALVAFQLARLRRGEGGTRVVLPGK